MAQPKVACGCAKAKVLRSTRPFPAALPMFAGEVLCVTQFGVAGTEADRPLPAMTSAALCGAGLSGHAVALSHLHLVQRSRKVNFLTEAVLYRELIRRVLDSRGAPELSLRLRKNASSHG